MTKQLSPIVLFVYNRPWHTQQTVKALQQNNLADKSELYIYCDGPKTAKDNAAVQELRAYIHAINGFKKIYIFEREKNFGLANSVSTGVSEVVNNHGKVIVLEDDIVTSQYFLQYMNEALIKYEKTPEVMQVSGFMFKLKQNAPETFFLRFSNSWGWATWKRAWDHYCGDAELLLKKITGKGISGFTANKKLDSFRMLKQQEKGVISSWAVMWYGSIFLNNGLVLYPNKSLVKNIGIDSSGTHCRNEPIPINFTDKKINISDIPINEDQEILKAVLKIKRRPLLQRIRINTKRIFLNLLK